MTEKHIPIPGSREAYELAAEIMRVDLRDYDLVLSADGSTYEWAVDLSPESDEPSKPQNMER